MVPESIRKVERPTNTVVAPSSKEGVYLVRERKGFKNGMPVNGKVIGHIIDGKYVKKDKLPKKISLRDITYKYYGKAAFADGAGKDLLGSLEAVYDENDSKKIYCVALLRSVFDGVKDYQIEDRYQKSFVSQFYPGVSLSRNVICNLISGLGKDYKGIFDFMENRVKAMVKKETDVLIDGMLKQNTSTVNTFSGFSYKGRIKGIADISIIYAVDSKTREPICMKVYKGNLPDFSNYRDFLEEFKIEEGLIIGDKGFPFDNSQDTFKDGKVGFIRPLKRNSMAAERLDLFSGMNFVGSVEGGLLGSKGSEKGKDGETRYYYCFQDGKRKMKEDLDYMRRAKKKNAFDNSEYLKKQRKFGTVVFVSNMDLKLENVYEYYKLRWEIELVFKSYKSVLSQTTTREHDDYSVNGSEFINFLSTIITIRMQNKYMENKDELAMTYNEVEEKLSDIIKATTDPDEKVWRTCTLNSTEKKLMETLGI